MIFSELYGAYYNTVASILKEAVDHPLEKHEIQSIIEKKAFGESLLGIEPALKEERWQLLNRDGTTNILYEPTMPATLIQKRWLKAISKDPRIRLFTDDIYDYPDVEPLFTADDYLVFDRYSDGDDYEDPVYIKRFRLMLDAIHKQYPLKIELVSHRGKRINTIILPKYMEYSEKDDKFRLFGSGKKFFGAINLGRIQKCGRYERDFDPTDIKEISPHRRSVTFDLVDERNALERVLLHFAHFEKEAERIEDDRYRVTIWYEKDDETEIVIRILSFGPMVRVIEPQSFIELIKNRLEKQRSCGL